jgi:chromosome partitioning protein
MRRIALASQKGGVGKSTTAACLAVGLARRGRTVLAVDCDGQANLTWTLTGGRGAEGPTLAEVLMRQADAEDAIRPTEISGLELLPADGSLAGVNVALVPELGRDTRLRSAMAAVAARWDFVILDTGPSFNVVLANALVYSSEVIAPVDPGVYAVLGLVALEETIGEVRDAYGADLRLSGLLLTRVTRSNVVRDIEAELRSRYGDRVFAATIPASSKVEEAATRGQTVLDWAPKSPAALAYDQLVSEVEDGRAEDGGRGDARRRAGAGDAA